MKHNEQSVDLKANRKDYPCMPADGSAFRTPEMVESEFDVFFEQEDFQRVSDLVGGSPNFSNADYISLPERVVVELKVLDKDYFLEGGIINRLGALIAAPVRVNENGTGIYTIALPDQNREGKNDSFEEPLRRVLKKANRQLRETIEKVLNGDGKGFVVLAMNRFRSVHIEVIQHLADELLKDEFSSISGYMLCTPGWGLLLPHSLEQGVVCYNWSREGVHPRLQQAWSELGGNWSIFAGEGGHGPVTMNAPRPRPHPSR